MEVTGTQGDDTLVGSEGDDVFRLQGGNDSASGGAGNDTFMLFLPLQGSATIDGGDGWDTFISPLTVQPLQLHLDLQAGTYWFDGAGSGTLRNIEQVQGTNEADDIRGDSADNLIDGGYGADTLLGAAGNDTLWGIDAATIDGGEGNDLVFGRVNGMHASLLEGGAGDDVIVAYSNGSATLAGGAGNDELRGGATAPSVAVFSGAIADYVITPMTDGGNPPMDGLVDEQLYVLVTDKVEGRDGSDKVYLSVGQLQFSDGVLDIAEFFPGVDTGAGDSIAGTDGNDVLMGLAGDDTLTGGAGDDTLSGGPGDDVIDGGPGIDWASYADTQDVQGVTVGLWRIGAQATGGGGNDTLLDIENVRGSLWGDRIEGNAQANVLEGGAGSDALDGREGADTMIGGADSDAYWVDNPADVVLEDADGGSADIVYAQGSYVLPAHVEQLVLVGVNGNSPTGTGNDLDNVIVGGGVNGNVLLGEGGADSITGSAGNDTFAGGAGADTLDGGDGYDIAVYDGRMADYAIAATDDGVTVTSVQDPTDCDTVRSTVERLEFSDGRVVLDGSGNPGMAWRLYVAALGRTPGPAELGYVIGTLDSGLTAAALAQDFIASPEFAQRYGGLSNTAFATQLYENVLHREPDGAGLAFIVGQLDAGISRAAVLLGFANSPENLQAAALAARSGIAYVPMQVGTPGADWYVAGGAGIIDGAGGIDEIWFSHPRADYQVLSVDGVPLPPPVLHTPSPLPSFSGAVLSGPDGSYELRNFERLHFQDATVAVDLAGNAGEAYRLYQTAFARTPDQAGLTFQVHALDAGASLSQVAANFIASPEFAATYGNLDNTQFVTLLYENALHREPDAAGLAFHVANLDAGMSRADVLVAFSESPENQAALIGAMIGGILLDPEQLDTNLPRI